MNQKLFIFTIILLITSQAFAKNLYKEKPAFYSYIIADTKTNHIYEEQASDVYATPASCLKTVTALVALKTLGPDYQYETKLYKTSGQDIVISFSGDPTLTSKNLMELLKPLKNTKIDGKLILDGSIYSTPVHSTNNVIGDIGTPYGQPVSGVNIDENLIIIKVNPTIEGKLAHVANDVGYKIKSTIITSSEASAVKFIWDGTQVKASGSINIEDKDREFKISPETIDPYVLFKMQKLLKQLNIQGKIQIIHDKKQLPTDLVLVKALKSEKLKDFMVPAMKISDNLVFDSLYLKIIHSYSTEEITDWSQGDKIIKALIEQHFSIDMDKALFVDGSGLSRLNRIQPKQLLEMLKQGASSPEFISSLSKPGEEKTLLINRKTLPDNIRAKSGGMLGISCLCGYSISTGKPKTFVIMANSFAPPAKEFLEVIDNFVKTHVGERT